MMFACSICISQPSLFLLLNPGHRLILGLHLRDPLRIARECGEGTNTTLMRKAAAP